MVPPLLRPLSAHRSNRLGSVGCASPISSGCVPVRSPHRRHHRPALFGGRLGVVITRPSSCTSAPSHRRHRRVHHLHRPSQPRHRRSCQVGALLNDFRSSLHTRQRPLQGRHRGLHRRHRPSLGRHRPSHPRRSRSHHRQRPLQGRYRGSHRRHRPLQRRQRPLHACHPPVHPRHSPSRSAHRPLHRPHPPLCQRLIRTPAFCIFVLFLVPSSFLHPSSRGPVRQLEA